MFCLSNYVAKPLHTCLMDVKWNRHYGGISNENVQLIIQNENKESPIPCRCENVTKLHVACVSIWIFRYTY